MLLTSFAVCFSIIKMQEAGLIERWRKNWWSSDSPCSSSAPKSSAETLDAMSLGGAFIAVMIAAGLAAIAAFLEYCVMKNYVNPKTVEIVVKK